MTEQLQTDYKYEGAEAEIHQQQSYFDQSSAVSGTLLGKVKMTTGTAFRA